MYADDNKDRIKSFGRNLRAIANADTLDPEDMVEAFDVIEVALNEARTLAVANLRRQGHSWDAIGTAMGMSRQAAHKKYGKAIAE